MTAPLPDRSRDRRIEDPTNLFLIHPLAQALLPWALRARIPADAVSLAGLLCGAASAVAFAHWREPARVLAGLVLAVCWLVLDGLDGKVARATGTSSAFGRFLDGACDHLVFIGLYVTIAATIGTAHAWTLAVAAGAAHIAQSAWYEGERHRFHRRRRGEPLPLLAAGSANPIVRGYDALAGAIDRLARPFEAALAVAPDPSRFGADYATRAVAPMRLLALLSANTRVLAMALACLAARPTLFWWFELGPLSAVAFIGLVWHRRVEARLARVSAGVPGGHSRLTA